MKIIASLNLLESGNVEFNVPNKIEAISDEAFRDSNRFLALEHFWDNPELQALLDKFIAADKGGVPFQ